MSVIHNNVAPSAGGDLAHSPVNKPLELPKLTDAQKEAIAKAMSALGDTLAVIVDDELNEIIVQVDRDKKNAAAGPFKLLRWLKEKVSTERLMQFPTPGSEVGDCPDKYEEPYFRDGKKKFRKTSFYLKFFLQHTPEGKRIAAALAHIAIAKDEKANHAAVPEDIIRLNPVDLEAYREELVSQQNNGVKALRDAVGLMIQFRKVNALAKVAAQPLMDSAGNVRKVQKPIKVWNTENAEQEWYLYSISGFMQFDADAAAELGGDIAALKLTAKREQGEEDGDPATSDKPVAINTNATFVARIGDVAEYVGNKLMADRKRELYGQFLKDHIATSDSGDLIYNLNELKLFIDGILNIPSVQSKLEEVNRAREAA